MATSYTYTRPAWRPLEEKLSGPETNRPKAPKPPVYKPPASKPETPKPQVRPFDAQSESEKANNQNAYDDTIAGIGYQRGRTAQDTGFDVLGNLDLSNPYNKAILLQRSYEQGQRGTRNAGAAGGQLYSGSTERSLEEGQFRYQRDYDFLRRGAQDAYMGLAGREQKAGTDLASQNIQSDAGALERAVARDPETERVLPNGQTATEYRNSVNKKYPGTLNPDNSINEKNFAANWAKQLKKGSRARSKADRRSRRRKK